MRFSLTVARVAAGMNVILSIGLGTIWLRNYRDNGAVHTLGLVVFAIFLLGENTLWVYFYVFVSEFVLWFVNAPFEIQFGLILLCALELFALLSLVRITWV